MSGLLDIHRKPAPPVIGLTDAEIAIVRRSLAFYQVELVSQRDFCGRMEATAERDGWARQVMELDVVRAKLSGEAPPAREETGT